MKWRTKCSRRRLTAYLNALMAMGLCNRITLRRHPEWVRSQEQFAFVMHVIRAGYARLDPRMKTNSPQRSVKSGRSCRGKLVSLKKPEDLHFPDTSVKLNNHFSSSGLESNMGHLLLLAYKISDKRIQRTGWGAVVQSRTLGSAAHMQIRQAVIQGGVL